MQATDTAKLRAELRALATEMGLTCDGAIGDGPMPGWFDYAVTTISTNLTLHEIHVRFHQLAFRKCRDGRETIIRRQPLVLIREDFSTDLKTQVCSFRFNWCDRPGEAALSPVLKRTAGKSALLGLTDPVARFADPTPGSQ